MPVIKHVTAQYTSFSASVHPNAFWTYSLAAARQLLDTYLKAAGQWLGFYHLVTVSAGFDGFIDQCQMPPSVAQISDFNKAGFEKIMLTMFFIFIISEKSCEKRELLVHSGCTI